MIAVDVFFHALWILCGAGAVVFAATSASATRQVVAFATGFVPAAFFASPERLPDPVLVGSFVALLAAWLIWRPALSILPLVAAGGLAGLWSSLLRVQGLPWFLAVSGAASVPLASALLARTRPGFAPEVLREEARLIVLVLSIATLVAPGIAEGWRSAVALNIGPGEAAATAVPIWTWLAVAGTTALGGVYSLWMRR